MMENFSEIYKMYHSKLVRFACDFLPSREDAENLVHDAFIELWKNNEHICEIKNINAYMFRLVRNRCLDFIKHMVHEKAYEAHALVEYKAREGALELMSDTELLAGELMNLVKREVEKLPNRCRQIFMLSRVDGMSHAEIAESLSLSENTVSVQLGIALRRLRAVTDVYMKK